MNVGGGGGALTVPVDVTVVGGGGLELVVDDVDELPPPPPEPPEPPEPLPLPPLLVVVLVGVVVGVLVGVLVDVGPEPPPVLQDTVKVTLVEPVPPLGAFTVVLDGVMLQDQPDGALWILAVRVTLLTLLG